MYPKTGKTQGRPHWYRKGDRDTEENYAKDKTGGWIFGRCVYVPGNCPHADKMRLRRLPKWAYWMPSDATCKDERRRWTEGVQYNKAAKRGLFRSPRMTKRELKRWQHEAARQSDTGMCSIPF